MNHLKNPYNKTQIPVNRTYSYDVEVVVVTERLQQFLDGFDGDNPSSTFHASAGVHQYHHVFGRTGCLDVP